ncbi:hypothetical protein C9E91_08340 [Rhizobium sp. SEMIA4064]|nr:hypothetical protein C9E91_08340 [Rhizobium sp. SEMIA4064]
MQHYEKLKAAEQQPEGEHGVEGTSFADTPVAKPSLRWGFGRGGRSDNALASFVAAPHKKTDGLCKVGGVCLKHGVYLCI